MKQIRISLVVPFFNEEKIIKKSLAVLSSYMDKNYKGSYELIFVNDGSKDKSLQIVEEEIKKYSRCRLISYKQNRGRGYAVTRGFREAKGEIVGFIDSDLEIHPKYIKKCVEELKENDIAVISKYVKGSNVKTTLLRKITSRIFNLWVGLVLDPELGDHQGGLKLAKLEVIKKILPKVKAPGWLFDLEFLYYAKRGGFKVSKVPVSITYGFRRVRASLGFDFIKSLFLVFKLRFSGGYTISFSSFLVFLFLFVLIALGYRHLPGTFFQQDEWQFFAADIKALTSGNKLMDVILPFGGQLTHFYPLANLFFLGEYLLFKMNFSLYAYLAIFLQFINGCLVYKLFGRFTKNKIITLPATAIFIVYSISHQAVTWMMMTFESLSAATLLLISFILFLNYLEKQKNRYFIYSLVAFVLSLLFKETTIFLFVFYPFLWILFSKRRFRLGSFFAYPWILFVGWAFFYGLLRFFFLFSSVRSGVSEVVDVTASSPMTYLLRLVFVPLKGFSQSFITQRSLISTSDVVTKFFYGSVIDTISQTVVFEKVAVALTLFIFIIFYFVFKKLKKEKDELLARAVIVLTLFGITSLLPFIFIPGKAGYFSIFEPRDLYLTSVAASFLICITVYTVVKKKALYFLVVFLVFLFHFLSLQTDLSLLKGVSVTRKSLLEKISLDYPTLPRNVIFLTISDRSYYGMPEDEKILPVQIGFGKMLMIWYQDKEKFPSCLYDQQFLLSLLSQGYRECDGRGFGYYRDERKMIEDIKSKKIKDFNVIAYSWDGVKLTPYFVNLHTIK